MKDHLFLLLLLLLITSSCRESSEKDFSLNQKEYEKLGMPAYSGIWGHGDYLKVCAALDRLKSTKPLSLPKKNSEKSGMYFDQMISLKNLSFLEDNSISLNDKAFEVQAYIGIQSQLAGIYTDILRREQYYNQELIDIYIFGLIITEKMLDLADKINNSNAEADIRMQSGYRAIQYSYLTMAGFVLRNQAAFTLYSLEDQMRLSDSIYNSISRNKGRIETPVRENLKPQLQVVIDSASSEYIKDKYIRLIEMI
jgi:hypothetical protein